MPQTQYQEPRIIRTYPHTAEGKARAEEEADILNMSSDASTFGVRYSMNAYTLDARWAVVQTEEKETA